MPCDPDELRHVPLFELLDDDEARDRKSTRLNSSHLGISYEEWKSGKRQTIEPAGSDGCSALRQCFGWEKLGAFASIAGPIRIPNLGRRVRW